MQRLRLAAAVIAAATLGACGPAAGDPGAPHPINAEGLSIGSTMDEVLAAYPGASVQFFNDDAWGDVYEIDVFQPATGTHMFFWSFEPHGEVQDIQWGNFPQEASLRGHTCAG